MGASPLLSYDFDWGEDGSSITWETCCINITDVENTDSKILAFSLGNEDGKFSHNNKNIVLQYSEEGGTWTTITNATEWIYYNAIAFTDGDTVTTAQCGAPWPTWVNGEKSEDNAVTITLPILSWTQIWWAVKPNNATPGSWFQFRMYNTSDSVALNPGSPIPWPSAQIAGGGEPTGPEDCTSTGDIALNSTNTGNEIYVQTTTVTGNEIRQYSTCT